jgi:hypothetical protein
VLFSILIKNLILFFISIETIDNSKQVLNPIFVFGFLIFKNNKLEFKKKFRYESENKNIIFYI